MTFPHASQSPEMVDGKQHERDPSAAARDDRCNLRGEGPDPLSRGVDVDHGRQNACERAEQCGSTICSVGLEWLGAKGDSQEDSVY